jgi:hypothetical protein
MMPEQPRVATEHLNSCLQEDGTSPQCQSEAPKARKHGSYPVLPNPHHFLFCSGTLPEP